MLVAAGLSMAVATTVVVQILQPANALAVLILLITANVAVVLLFVWYVVGRLIVRPLARLGAAADELAAGELSRRAPSAETAELTRLAESLNRMTERLLDAQGQLVRAEKMAGIGRLAAGIAHEVGNPLSAMSTYVDVLARRHAADDEVAVGLRREIGRIDRIVRGLLTYARPEEEMRGPVDVAQVLRGVLELLTHQGALNDVRVADEIAATPLSIEGSAHGLEQAFVNLLLNAVAAVGRGTIAVGAAEWTYQSGSGVRSRRGDRDPQPPRRARPGKWPWRPELREGAPGVLVWVADSGPGVPEELGERVFDPFFTTKDPGEGTGLGLAIVQRTVHEAGGLVWVDRAREGGAAFKVFLPGAP